MIRWLAILLISLLVAAIVYINVNNGTPEELGVIDGQLILCPESPNCVSSQSDISDKQHFIKAISYQVSRPNMQLTLEKYLLSTSKYRIVKSELGYLHTEVESDLIGFIDDVEFYLPKDEKLIHIRSASRVGFSDFDVNRNRVRQISAALVK
jgi:uncharacterized protein (DUF1499 family)